MLSLSTFDFYRKTYITESTQFSVDSISDYLNNSPNYANRKEKVIKLINEFYNFTDKNLSTLITQLTKNNKNVVIHNYCKDNITRKDLLNSWVGTLSSFGDNIFKNDIFKRISLSVVTAELKNYKNNMRNDVDQIKKLFQKFVDQSKKYFHLNISEYQVGSSFYIMLFGYIDSEINSSDQSNIKKNETKYQLRKIINNPPVVRLFMPNFGWRDYKVNIYLDYSNDLMHLNIDNLSINECEKILKIFNKCSTYIEKLSKNNSVFTKIDDDDCKEMFIIHADDMDIPNTKENFEKFKRNLVFGRVSTIHLLSETGIFVFEDYDDDVPIFWTGPPYKITHMCEDWVQIPKK